MIDFHAHILPGCDHGSDGLETSLKQLKLAKEAGVSTVIATPHFYPQRESFADFLARREETEKLLRAHQPGIPEVLIGCEVNLCQGLDHIEGIGKTCVQGTKVMLLEMPMNYWSASVEETLLRMHDDSGFVIVLAHVDRYDPDRIDRLLSYGILAQINAESICIFRGRRRLLRWIDEGNVVALGSDIHGVRPGYAEFTKAIRILGRRAETVFHRTERLLEENQI